MRGPSILVAHSMGALTSRAFAATYPDEVAGVVLVAPRDHDIVTFSCLIFPEQPAASDEPTLVERWLGPLAARLGLMCLADMLGSYVGADHFSIVTDPQNGERISASVRQLLSTAATK